MQLRSFDTIDQRVLAALEFLDANTGARITAPLSLSCEGYGFLRNRAGLYVINQVVADHWRERRLRKHLASFEAPLSQPGPGSEHELVTVTDPKAQYLPQIFDTALPRVGDDLRTPIQVELYPSPTALVAPNWSGIRCSLRGNGDLPLIGARVRLIRDSDDVVLGQSFTDERGEALVIAVGIPVIDFSAPANGNGQGQGNGAVGAATTLARLSIETRSTSGWPPHPDRFAANTTAWRPVQGALPQLNLRTGQILTKGLSFSLEPQP
ncbi:MAG: hypothetical protein ACPGNV_06775 [Mangrovicoccus sp.]